MISRRELLRSSIAVISGVGVAGCVGFFEDDIDLEVVNGDQENERAFHIELLTIDQEAQTENRFWEASFEIGAHQTDRTTIGREPDIVRVTIDNHDPIDLDYSPPHPPQCEEVNHLTIYTTFRDSEQNAELDYSCRR